jgi:hypothetical protein
MNLLPRLIAILALLCATVTPSTWAHDPFDGNLRMTVHRDGIELLVTVGTDAADAYLSAIGLPRTDIVRITRATGEQPWVQLPLAGAARLVQLSADGKPLAPIAFAAAPSELEPTLRLVYPPPAAGKVRVDARYFQLIDYMRPGSLVVITPDRRMVANALLSRDHPTAVVPLKHGAFDGARLFDYFKLGVEHILLGFDHLLFLAALLIGVTAVRSMLIIISGFTVGHSLTLALAAFDILVPPSALVEPVIAASIVLVALYNLLRRSAARHRYWAAGVFGLIHGFGFAGLLRDTMLAERGRPILEPLLGFNLGIEAGQLLVAAVFVPLLLAARKYAWFERRGAPVLSLLVAGVAAVWLVERVVA